MSENTDERAAIISRMRELRSTGLTDVKQLHAQVGRVTDWREHVRAHPELSVIAASILGFSVVKAMANSVTPVQQIVYAPPVSVAKQRSTSMGLLSIAGGLAASMARQWLTEYVKKQVGVHAHATNQPTDAGQRSHSTS